MHADDSKLDLSSALTFQGKAAPKSVQVLRFKNLSIEMKFLGIVAEVKKKDLIVSFMHVRPRAGVKINV